MIDVVLWQVNRKKIKAETQFYFNKWIIFTSALKDTLFPFIAPGGFDSATPYLSVPAGRERGHGDVIKNHFMEIFQLFSLAHMF